MKRIALVALVCCLSPLAAAAAPNDVAGAAPAVKRTHTLSNGATIVTDGGALTYHAPDGRETVVNRADADASRPPAKMRAASCASWLQTIVLAPTLNRAWRRAVANYAMNC